MNNYTIAPFSKPLYIMLKPVGAICNLRCSYCYYLDKKELYPEETQFLMSDKLLEKFTKEYIESQTRKDVAFIWHGGESLIRNIDFYKKALLYQQKYANGHKISNVLQTNGTLITEEWCHFFKDHNFLIGISIDGPQHCHDKYRKTKGDRHSFFQVVRGIELLKKHEVEFNIMAVVNDYNVNYPLELYNFFKNLGAKFIQFSPIVEQVNGNMAEWNVPSEKWGDFLITIFKEWVKRDVGQIFIQMFDSALANWVGIDPGTCIFSKTCGHAGVMEFNGDVYACDHFVYPEYKIGNIYSMSPVELMYSQKQINFGNDKYDKLPKQCKACKYQFACRGECPKNRIIKTADGEIGLNYLCKGYYKFFNYIAPYMDFMKNELEHKRPPANIMNRKLPLG